MIKLIEGTDNKAIVTSDGRVFKRYVIKKGYKPVGWTEFKEVKPRLSSGYLSVTIPYREGCSIHRLVAEAFVPNPLGLRDVDHIDGNRTNNNPTNLRWVTHKENCNNPNTKYKHVFSSNHKVLSYIQGFNPKSNFRTPIFTNIREASNWITPEGKKINTVSLANALRLGRKYRGYFWTAKLVTGEEYATILRE